MLDKTYDAAAIEPRVYAAWEKAGAFKAGAGAKAGAKPYAIVIPPPNVTGSSACANAAVGAMSASRATIAATTRCRRCPVLKSDPPSTCPTRLPREHSQSIVGQDRLPRHSMAT